MQGFALNTLRRVIYSLWQETSNISSSAYGPDLQLISDQSSMDPYFGLFLFSFSRPRANFAV